MEHICKNISVTANEHSLLFRKDGKDLLKLPVTLNVNGATYTPSLTNEENESITYTDGFASIVVRFLADAVTVEATLIAEQELAVFNTHLFVDGGIAPVGFDRAYTPQPRNNNMRNCTMFSSLPDISANGYHTPPCLMFSVGSPLGWVSYGLLDIPDTRMCRMEDDGSFLIESCGGHKKIGFGETYRIPRVIVAFPEDEYDGITTFRRHLTELGLYTPCRPKWDELPEWWKHPQFCTYGDQLIERRVGQLIDDAWVREFVERSERDFGVEHMVICIDDSWQLPHSIGPAVDTKRFPDLRKLIDDMHARGHRVMLWYTPMFEKTSNGIPSRAAELGVLSEDAMTGRYFDNFPGCYAIDYTSDGAEQFLRETAEILFGDGEGQLNADAVKLDFLANLRDPAKATSYQHPEYGIGMREYYRYYSLFRAAAKAVKPDVMINATLNDPRFEHLIDVSRLHDTHSGEEEKERRARMMALACPDLPIDTDGALMMPDWLRRNHISAAVCGLHSIYYTYAIGRPELLLSDKEKRAIGALVSMTVYRPAGTPVTDGNGHWQLLDNDGRVMADTIRGETVIYYPQEAGGVGHIFSFLDELVTIPLHGRKFSALTPAPEREFCEVDYARDTVRVYLKAGRVYTFRDEDDGSSVDRVFLEMNAHTSEETMNYVNS